MNSLEKYAAKKKLTKKMLERLSSLLYGKKPPSMGSSIGSGVGTGYNYGASLGGLAGAMKPKSFGADLMGPEGAFMLGTLLGSTSGAAAGAGVGAIKNRIALKKYLANQAMVNKKLAIGGAAAGGAGGGALAALLARKKDK